MGRNGLEAERAGESAEASVLSSHRPAGDRPRRTRNPPVSRRLRLSGDRATVSRTIFEEDARGAQAFVDRWRPRIEAMTNARHRGMLRVILGETLEQKRFFEQALAGDKDLLGRRGEQTGARVGSVLPERWIE